MALVDDIKDPVLDEIVKALEAKMEPKMKTGYLIIVNAGMKLLFSDQTHHFLIDRIKQAQQSGNVAMGIAKGTSDLMAVLYKESRGKFFMPALIPAATTLMCHIFDFAEHMGAVKVERTMIGNAVHVMTVGVLKTFGITQGMLAKGADNLKARRKAGEDMIHSDYGSFQGGA